MLDSPRDIDTSNLSKLSKLKREQELLQSYFKKAEELKDEVAPAVFIRVQQDYRARHAHLARQAEPIRAEVRKEYHRLESLCAAIEANVNEAGLQKEALEFRYSVGELGQAELAAQVADLERALQERSTELSDANQLRRSFEDALTPQPDLGAHGAAPVPGPGPRSFGEGGPSPDNTVIVPDLFQRAGTIDLTPDRDLADPPSVMKTLVPPQARLIKDDGGGSRREYRLGIFTYIGRAQENHIALEVPGVSGQHAQVTAGSGGYTVKDLGSQNGTFVNDERITERRLKSGDRVRMGDLELTFLSP